MVRYADITLCAILAVIWLMLATPLYADRTPAGFELGRIDPTEEAAVDAYQRAGGEHCATRECVALATILTTETDDAKDLINRSREFCQGAQWASAACKRIAR